LDSFENVPAKKAAEEETKTAAESPSKKPADLASKVIAAIPEADKNSNFGDYGEESEDEDEDEDDSDD